MMTEEKPALCLPCGRRRATVGHACQKCRDTLEWRLNDIQELYALLPAMLIPGGAGESGGGGKPGKRDAGPLPGVEIIMNLLGRSNGDNAVHRFWCTNCRTPTGEQYHPDPVTGHDDERTPFEIRCTSCGRTLDPAGEQQVGPIPTLELLGLWVRLVAEERSLTQRPPGTVHGCASFLRRHLDWICAQGWVDDFADETKRAHNTLRDVCGEHRPVPIGICRVLVERDGQETECGADLYLPLYTDTITCNSCHEEWPRERWLLLGAALLDAS